MKMRQLLTQAFRFGMILAYVLIICDLIIWEALMCVSTRSEFRAGVVISGSMEPGVKRGDILVIKTSKEPIRAGEIVLFKVDGHDIPSVHRVIEVHERSGDSGEVDVLTKGDYNEIDDTSLYDEGQLWLHRDDIMGKAVGYLPYLGWFNIIISEKPIIKYIIVAAMTILYMNECVKKKLESV